MNSHPSHRTATRGCLTGVSLTLALSASACVLDMSGSNRTQREPSPVEGDSGAAESLDAAEPEGDERDAEPQLDGAATFDAAPADATSIAQPEASTDERDARAEEATDASTPQPRDDGSVGTLDAQARDASDGRDASDAAPVVDASQPPPPPPPQCNLEGTFAVQLEYDVTWRGTTIAGFIPLLAPGSGQVRVWSMVEVRAGGMRARVRGCGASLPDFASGNARVGNELYSAYIPATTWDQPGMPRWELGLQPACLRPGCELTSDLLATTVGARVTGNSPWPGPNGSLAGLMLVDQDNDQAPGVTLFTRNRTERSPDGTPYVEPPLTWTLGTRATQLYMAFQIAFRLDGALESCDLMAGDLQQGRVENRVASCFAHSASTEANCTPEQARFADQNLPEWTVSAGRFRGVRLASGATCADVRAALD